MKEKTQAIMDGNEATSSVAFRLSETIAIYPITPSSTMAEFADEWAAKGQTNIWGNVPDIVEMESEGGASAAMHGALQAGSLTTTFTASQGLLLMIPNMYKIAGELTPMCMHVSARALASHALSIFGDHQDVMACRQTGFAMLASNSVQEAHDMACIGHAAALESRVSFMHFFEGFRTSHEINTLKVLTDEQLASMVDEDMISAHRKRALTPDSPIIRGTAQNPDVYFQGNEARNPFYDATPEIVEKTMNKFAEMTGRQYKLFDYVGAEDAERVVISIGSSCETLKQAMDHLNAEGEKVGLLKVHLFRPFSIKHFVKELPSTVKSIAVLDRTKECGSLGEPLLLDVRTALADAREDGLVAEDFLPKVIGGRYGLGSKEFTPAMAKAVYDELKKETPKKRFTVGIIDDVTHLSLDVDNSFDVEHDNVKRAIFWGLGSDGTVGANKNSVKIIGNETDNYAQAYFVYDSKKSGGITTSHLRFGPDPIRAPYLIQNAQFVACHQFSFVEKYDVLDCAAEGGVFLLNSIFDKDKVWDHLPAEMQAQIINKKLKFYVIDAYKVARETGMGGRINTVMQTCYFAISNVLPADEAISYIKAAIKKTYGKKGDAIVQKNYTAVDASVANLFEVEVPAEVTADAKRPPIVSDKAPEFVRNVMSQMMLNKGDDLPVSALPVDGTFPTATTQWEKRNIGLEIPAWDEGTCIQCNKCAFVCPHAAIRAKYYDPEYAESAPEGWQSKDYRNRKVPGKKFTIQVAPEDCTGCGLCVQVCPAKNKAEPNKKAINMVPQEPIREVERAKFEHFLSIPDPDKNELDANVKGTQFRRPLFEFSGACAGCGETAYVKLLSQLFGDRALIANATGCSSIYSGNLPTTPYAVDACGRGPAWSNSLFEDNAEFGFGMRFGVDMHESIAKQMVKASADKLGDDFVTSILEADQSTEAGIDEQRTRVASLKEKLTGCDCPNAKRLLDVADYLVKKSVWILGGDGWAYDIGYGGLDHVLASGRNVNVLVMDTGVYSNTGGQSSKATPMGAVAKFAAAGKASPKKDLGMMAMMYGNVYVAQVAMGSSDAQTVKAFMEAESYDGPSLIIAYSHCIAHGFNLQFGLEQQKLAVNSGIFPLYRYDPRKVESGEAGMVMDSKTPTVALSDYMQNEARFRMLQISNPERAKELAEKSQEQVSGHFKLFEHLAGHDPKTEESSEN
jgi:pyruvate-ferredoxin/flavodoxin oxidoreductase